MIKKPINQNEERYITKSDRYQISATSSIKPLDLPFGEMPENLFPVLEVDGIIVNVGEYKLVSQATLDSIKESNNPHYDIKDNGEVKGKKIGQTIPSITLNMDKLLSVIKERDIQNRIAGVVDVEYVTEGDIVGETNIPLNLVQQINYTLNSDIDRPMDTYTLAELQLSDESNYDLTGIEIVTRQSNEQIFDNTKLEIFLTDIKKRMQALGKDFDTIKDIHYSGLIPNDVDTFSITKMATSEDVQEADDFQIVYKSSKLVSVEKTPAQILKEEQIAAANQLSTQLQQAVTAQQQALAGAQSADSRTQQYIQQQLDATRAQLAQVQKSLQK
jgi:hypothetical protein